MIRYNASTNKLEAYENGSWADLISTGASGEANTASNIGGAGVGVFVQKTSSNLEFKNINSATPAITVTNDTGNNEIDIGLNINGATAETTIAGVDEILIHDASAGALRKMTRTNFVLSESEVDTMVSNNGYLTSSSIGSAAGQVMAADAVPNCNSSEKLQMSAGPTYSWSCVTDETGGGSSSDSLTDADSNTLIQVEESADENRIRFDTAGTERMIIDESGNVGIGVPSPAVSLDISEKTDALSLPSGTTAQRPGAAANGMIRYNASTNKFEAYEAGSWTDMISAASGEANTASNVGSAGVGVFVQKTSSNLEFKNINAGSSAITVTNDVANNEIDININPSQINITSLNNYNANSFLDHSSLSILTGANSGLTGGGNLTANRSLSVNINGTTAVTGVSNTDELLIFDTSAGALRKITRSNFVLSESEVDALANNNGYLTGSSIGTGAGQVMGAGAVPNCTSSQKLQMSAGPPYNWSCVTDETGGGSGDTIADADSDTKVEVEASADEDKVKIPTGGSERLVVDNFGNVGINVTSPTTKFSIAGDTSFRTPAAASRPTILDTTFLNKTAFAAGTTVSHTVSSGTDKVLVVLIAGSRSSWRPDFTSIVYDGVALTEHFSILLTGDGGTYDEQVFEVWYLINPNEGTNDLVFTLSSTAQYYNATILTLGGVDQINPLEAVQTQSGTDIASTLVVPSTNSSLVLEMCAAYNPDTVAPTGAQTTLASLSVNLHSTGYSASIPGSAPNVSLPCSRAFGGFSVNQLGVSVNSSEASDFPADTEFMRVTGGKVGIGTSTPESTLQVEGGYIQMDTTTGAPPAADCNATAEYGRMKFDSSTGVNKLYICGADGWAVFDAASTTSGTP